MSPRVGGSSSFGLGASADCATVEPLEGGKGVNASCASGTATTQYFAWALEPKTSADAIKNPIEGEQGCVKATPTCGSTEGQGTENKIKGYEETRGPTTRALGLPLVPRPVEVRERCSDVGGG